MRRLIAIAIAIAIASPALAADPAAKQGAPGTNVEMPFLIAPMSKNGKLLGYSYISSKLVASSARAALAVRDKLAFIQDAFVRDVNAAPIGSATDPTKPDTDLLNTRLTADAKRVVGADKVVNMVFTQMQFAPLHPKQTTEDEVPPTDTAPGQAADQTAQNISAAAPATGTAVPATNATKSAATQ